MFLLQNFRNNTLIWNGNYEEFDACFMLGKKRKHENLLKNK